MGTGDLHSFPEVEPVRAMPRHTGVELEGSAALLPRHPDEPVEHPLTVTFRTGILGSHEVVYVEDFSMGQKLDDPEPCHAPYLPTLGRKGHPVARASQAVHGFKVLLFFEVRA